MSQELKDRGHTPEPQPGDRPQALHVRLLSSLLSQARDPDAEVFNKTFATGVPLGGGRSNASDAGGL